MNYLERVKELKREWSDPPTDVDTHNVINVENVKSPADLDDLSGRLLSRLQAGTWWFTAQHQAWIDAKPDAASNERFSIGLAGWGEMERSLRLVYNYEGCIFGPGQRCPEDSPVSCDSCTLRTQNKGAGSQYQ